MHYVSVPSGKSLPVDGLGEEIASILVGHLARQRRTQKDVEAATGISQSRISKVLRGAAPINVIELQRIAGYLGVTVTEIADEAERVSGTATAAKRITDSGDVPGEDPDASA